MNISVLVNTRNEELNIDHCLGCIPPDCEIIVVDMESTDRTCELARRYTDHVYNHTNLGYADPARAFALSMASRDWVLILDADEVLDPELWSILEGIISEDTCDVVVLPFRTWMFGQEIKGGGWGPGQDRHERFFRRSMNILSPRVHAMFDIPPLARVTNLPYPGPCVWHFNYVDLEHFLSKYNRYTTIEAANMLSGLKKTYPGIGYALAKGIKDFFRRFFRLGGFRDGITGFILASLMLWYPVITWYKYHNLKKFPGQIGLSGIQFVYDQIRQGSRQGQRKSSAQV